MSSRSVLRIRQEPHIRPDRRDETIIEVVRDGEVVATIYGSREGVHIASDRLTVNTPNTPFRLNLPPSIAPMPGFVVPLLGNGEICPWCDGKRRLEPTGEACPSCNPEVTEFR